MSGCYAGVDYGMRKLAIAVLTDGECQFYDYDWPKPTTKKALALAGPEELGDHLVIQESTASGIFAAHRPSLVAIERPLTSKLGGNSIMALNQVSGVLALAARCSGSPITYVASNTWKKVVCGHGGLDKAGVARWVEAHHPEVFRSAPTQDCLDAFCLALGAQMEADEGVVGALDVL